jgi:uncharacterized repeat protein (TIGR03803 family)
MRPLVTSYRVTPSGVLTKLYDFPANTFRGYFAVPLLQAADDNLYGATPNGGANGTGAIYRLDLRRPVRPALFVSGGQSLGGPTALIEGSDGNLYGATLGSLQDWGLQPVVSDRQDRVNFQLCTT